MKKVLYPGWELKYFDKANNFRNYQFSLIKNYIHGEIAEVGPGNGITASRYLYKAKRIFLYEPSINLFKKLKSKFKNNKKVILKNSFFKISKKKFNTIIFLDVIEHIKDDIGIIKIALKNLKKGGNLIINVPAFNYLYSDFDKDIGHFKRYSNQDIKIIKKKINSIVLKYNINFFYYDSIGFILSLLNKIFSSNYKNNLKQKIYLWNKLIIISKFLDIILMHKIGKSMCLIITKKN